MGMIACDLYILYPNQPGRTVQLQTSNLIGEHSINGHDRTWAESGDVTTKKWISLYKVSSIFGGDMEPVLDIAYIGRECDSVATPFSRSSLRSVKLKSRTKV